MKWTVIPVLAVLAAILNPLALNGCTPEATTMPSNEPIPTTINPDYRLATFSLG